VDVGRYAGRTAHAELDDEYAKRSSRNLDATVRYRSWP